MVCLRPLSELHQAFSVLQIVLLVTELGNLPSLLAFQELQEEKALLSPPVLRSFSRSCRGLGLGL